MKNTTIDLRWHLNWILHLEYLYRPQEVNLFVAEVQTAYTRHNKH